VAGAPTAGGRLGAGSRGGLARDVDVGGLDVGGGEFAGSPEGQHGFELGEQAGEAGENEGVQSRHRPGLGGAIVGFGAESCQDAGDLLGQWGRGIF